MSLKQKIRDFRDRRPAVFQAAVVAALFVFAILVFTLMMSTRRETARQRMKIPDPRVEVIKAQVGPERVRVTGEGTVSPLREIDLIPQVGGRVVFISPAMVDGGQFDRGEELLRIDPVDYELAVESARAQVKDLESKLMLTEEEAEAAREEWRIQNGGGSEPPSLVAKEPQLAAARAALQGARANLDKARLNLERTSLKAPFDGRISSKSVDIGQFVAVGQPLARLFSVEAAEIMVPLDDSDLRWIDVPGFTSGGRSDSRAVVKGTIAGRDFEREGVLMRTEGRLDERTRMVNVVVRVDRPYEGRPPLAMGLFVDVEIEGATLPEAIWLPRSAVHENDVVYIVDSEGRIRFTPVEIARYDRDDVLVSSGISSGDLVVLTPMRVVTDGMKVTYTQPEAGSE